MTRVFCDASVVLKWFHADREDQVAESRALAIGAAEGAADLRVLDLTYFEIGNVLSRRLRWGGAEISSALRLIAEISGEPVRLRLSELGVCAELAADRGLSFYDAGYWAAALTRRAHLATMDSALLAAGAGHSPAALCERLGIVVG